MIVTGSVIGFIFLLMIVAAVIFCLTRKNKKPAPDAFTKWSTHYDNKPKTRNDDLFNNDIHHFYNKNTLTSLRPHQLHLPMVEYNVKR